MFISRNFLVISFFVLICFGKTSYGQDLEVGFRIESQGLQAKYTDGSSFFFWAPAPECIQASIGLYPYENLTFEVRGGGILFDEYTGYDYGLYTKYFLSKLFYLTGGLAVHYNTGGGDHNGGGKVPGSIYMPSIALGVQYWKHTSFEVLYQKGNNEPYAYETGLGVTPSRRITVDWIVKLGIVFTWNSL